MQAGNYVVAVTFLNVPLFSNPSQTASFQMLLRPTGVVSYVYQGIGPDDGLVGISSGASGPLPTEENYN